MRRKGRKLPRVVERKPHGDRGRPTGQTSGSTALGAGQEGRQAQESSTGASRSGRERQGCAVSNSILTLCFTSKNCGHFSQIRFWQVFHRWEENLQCGPKSLPFGTRQICARAACCQQYGWGVEFKPRGKDLGAMTSYSKNPVGSTLTLLVPSEQPGPLISLLHVPARGFLPWH